MRPILFEITITGDLQLVVPAYGTFLLLGFLLALWLIRRRASNLGLVTSDVLNLGYSVILLGMVGAHLLHAAVYWDAYTSKPALTDLSTAYDINLWKLIAFWEGGLIYYGGLIGGIVAAVLFALFKKIPVLDLLDLTAPPAVLGLALTRIGCFFNGCCFGQPTQLPWSVQFPAESYVHIKQLQDGLIVHGETPLAVHPTQLYELVAALLIFVILWIAYNHRKFAGEIFFSFGLLYTVWRFFKEFFRADSYPWKPELGTWAPVLGTLNLYQYLSIVLFIIFGALMLWFAGRHRKHAMVSEPNPAKPEPR